MRHPVRPTVDWSTAGWGASGPMGAGQPTDGGVAPMREPSALHDGRGWGGAHLQPWPGVDDGGRQAHSDAIVVDGMCGRFGAMGCPPRRAATRRLTGAMIPAPHAARSVPMGCWVRPCGRDGRDRARAGGATMAHGPAGPSRWDAGCGRVVGMAGEAAPTRGRVRPGCVGRVRVTMHAVTWGPCPPIGRAGRPGCFLTQGGGRCRWSLRGRTQDGARSPHRSGTTAPARWHRVTSWGHGRPVRGGTASTTRAGTRAAPRQWRAAPG